TTQAHDRPPHSAITTKSHAPPTTSTSSQWIINRPAPWPTAVMRTVRPDASPPTRRRPTSTERTEGSETVCAVPRTHIEGSSQTITLLIAHCIGADPSYTGAASAAHTPKNRIATRPRALTTPSIVGTTCIGRHWT